MRPAQPSLRHQIKDLLYPQPDHRTTKSALTFGLDPTHIVPSVSYKSYPSPDFWLYRRPTLTTIVIIPIQFPQTTLSPSLYFDAQVTLSDGIHASHGSQVKACST
jgi:hypothetical protein